MRNDVFPNSLKFYRFCKTGRYTKKKKLFFYFLLDGCLILIFGLDYNSIEQQELNVLLVKYLILNWLYLYDMMLNIHRNWNLFFITYLSNV